MKIEGKGEKKEFILDGELRKLSEEKAHLMEENSKLMRRLRDAIPN